MDSGVEQCEPHCCRGRLEVQFPCLVAHSKSGTGSNEVLITEGTGLINPLSHILHACGLLSAYVKHTGSLLEQNVVFHCQCQVCALRRCSKKCPFLWDTSSLSCSVQDFPWTGLHSKIIAPEMEVFPSSQWTFLLWMDFPFFNKTMQGAAPHHWRREKQQFWVYVNWECLLWKTKSQWWWRWILLYYLPFITHWEWCPPLPPHTIFILRP